MLFRIYPYPKDDICTPFIKGVNSKTFVRGVLCKNRIKKIELQLNGTGDLRISGIDKKAIVGKRLPDRKKILEYIVQKSKIAKSFLKYIESVVVIPTFPLSKEEAFVKTVIRQVIRAKMAKIQFSFFIKTFGIKQSGIYCFPNAELLRKLSVSELEAMGYGFKANRIISGIKSLLNNPKIDIDCIRGVGPWSSRVIKSEVSKNYTLYPFFDLSCQKIYEVTGVDLLRLSRHDRILAGDVYIYSASFLEASA